MPPSDAVPSLPDLHRRLIALEEHVGFSEHTVEQLSAELTECHKRVHTLSARVAALEDRLARLLQPEQDEPPADA